MMLANQDCQILRNETYYMLSLSNSIQKTPSAEPTVARTGKKKIIAFYRT
jgi:hypothetical protein